MEEAAVAIVDFWCFPEPLANVHVERRKLPQDEGSFKDFDVALNGLVIDPDDFGRFRVVPMLTMVVRNQLQ